MNKKFYTTVLIFIPMFISANGIYQRDESISVLRPGEESFVFPIISIMAIWYFLLIMINIYKSKLLYINKFYTIVISLIFIYTLSASLLGYVIYNEIIILLRWFQFIAFLLGIVVFYYLVYIKRININIFLKSLFYFILTLIIIHFSSSFLERGIINSVQTISPNIFFFSIYQSRVYYPYLIVALFFMSIVSVKNIGLKNISILLLIIYIFSLQVRGAFISLLLYLILYFIFIHRNKTISLIGIVIFMFFTIQNQGFIQNFDFGRFGNIDQLFTLSGRIFIWQNDLQTENLFSFVFGNLFFDQVQKSSHNQFIHFYNYGGIILVLLFLIAVLPFFRNLLLQIKRKDTQAIFLMMSFFIPFFIDLNINVPLNNINSGIIYLFIWSIILHLTSNDKYIKKYHNDLDI